MANERASKTKLQKPILSSESSENADKLVDDILSEGESFNSLKTTLTGGTHFQFKLEKSWTLMDAPVNSKFRVQISSMAQNFSNIPFKKRRNLYFTHQHNSKFHDDQNLHDKNNDTSVEKNDISSNLNFECDTPKSTSLSKRLDELDKESLLTDTVAEKTEIQTSTNIISTKENKSKDDDTACNLKFISENSGQHTDDSKSNKHDLEDWLDSILDD